MLLQLLVWIIIVQVILSWLVAFNVINTSSNFVRTLLDGLDRLTAPLYRPIRKILPDFGGIDFSPIVAHPRHPGRPQAARGPRARDQRDLDVTARRDRRQGRRGRASRARSAAEVDRFRAATGRAPGLAVVLVGEDPACAVYVRAKGKATREAGMESFAHKLARRHAARPSCWRWSTGSTPTPRSTASSSSCRCRAHIDANQVITRDRPRQGCRRLPPDQRRAARDRARRFVPCTPLGCLKLLQAELGDLAGKTAVVIGRSNIVGKPMAHAPARRKLHRDHRPQPHRATCPTSSARPTSSSPRSAAPKWSRATGSSPAPP